MKKYAFLSAREKEILVEIQNSFFYDRKYKKETNLTI